MQKGENEATQAHVGNTFTLEIDPIRTVYRRLYCSTVKADHKEWISVINKHIG